MALVQKATRVRKESWEAGRNTWVYGEPAADVRMFGTGEHGRGTCTVRCPPLINQHIGESNVVSQESALGCATMCETLSPLSQGHPVQGLPIEASAIAHLTGSSTRLRN